MSKKDKDKSNTKLERKPWIEKIKGLRIIIVVSLSLALWVGFQIVRAEGNWGKGILWGSIFGASIALVYFGMNAFHTWMRKDKDKEKEK